MQTKIGEGNERRGRTNLARIVRSQQEFLGEKIRKRQEQGATMFAVTAPVLLYLGCMPLKGNRAKMMMCLTNARRPLMIKGDTPTTRASPYNPSSTQVCATPTLACLALLDMRRTPMGASQISVSILRFLRSASAASPGAVAARGHRLGRCLALPPRS
jgi:hypothetical protein